MRINIVILILLCTSFSIAAKNLFSPNESSKIVATKNKDNSLGLFVSKDVYQKIILEKKDNFILEVPFFNDKINLSTCSCNNSRFLFIYKKMFYYNFKLFNIIINYSVIILGAIFIVINS